MELISKDYRNQCEEMHQVHIWGTKGFKYIDRFLPLCQELGATTILDYGCGKNTIKQHMDARNLGIEVVGYDPAIPEYSNPPQPADFVVCTDVMEHVEEEYVDATLSYIYSLMKLGGYFSIAVLPSKFNLPDGRNVHITLHPIGWWAERMQKVPWRIIHTNVGKKHLSMSLRK